MTVIVGITYLSHGDHHDGYACSSGCSGEHHEETTLPTLSRRRFRRSGVAVLNQDGIKTNRYTQSRAAVRRLEGLPAPPLSSAAIGSIN
ncbi:hypothetical protein [Candidatus Reidiella endopervernicosa]|uniref:Uncharacterized protein n=1 Tax=Candidatus Reidiella endopervernicosa TaxID=2738883 RepID=A0A6N0I0G7_9GAMM|nr:hypothetical protein [Candidatus Reidiella endopervernicosa]QKQ27956.1 hypothetical protein HUE57_17950 [Candidatus Reidiella endopervernicosa]